MRLTSISRGNAVTERDPIIADLTDYLDARGSIAVNGERMTRLADFMTQLVARVTMAYGHDLPLGLVRCRRKRCSGYLQVLCNTGAIVWHCDRCGDKGAITHWRNTLWDLLDVAPESEDAPPHLLH